VSGPHAAATQFPASPSQGDGPLTQAPEGRSQAWLSIALVLVAGLALAAGVILAAAHLNDRYLLDHVSGSRMALAKYFNDGTLYPELFNGAFYGGTRWMPVPIILHGVLARLTGDYLVSGKLLSYVAMAALLLTMFWVMRRLGTPFPLALGLTAVVLATRTGLSGAMDIRLDALPLLLQIMAVHIVSRTSRPRAVVGAAALSALALMSKVSALWAPIAVVVWLLGRDRRRLLWFTTAYVGFAGVALLIFIAISDGRIVENIFGLSASGITGPRSLFVAPWRLVDVFVSHAPAAWALLPFIGFVTWRALKERAASIYLTSLVCALGILIVVLADIGTGWNQLLDVIVLSALVVGELAGRPSPGAGVSHEPPGGTVSLLLALTVLWVVASGAAVTLVPDVQEAVARPDSYGKAPLDGVVTPRSTILSEDPYIPLSLGQTPVVLDPFMLLRIGSQDPAARASLVERIEARQFDLVVLVVPLKPLDQEWWVEYHFGPDIVRAIAGSYASAGRVEGYYLYTPVPEQGSR
jgi:hypothetical protein